MIRHRRIDELLSPYIAEAGLASALEPSTMLLKAKDGTEFHIDSEQDREEPDRPQLDLYCLDRYQGPQRAKKEKEVESDDLSQEERRGEG